MILSYLKCVDCGGLSQIRVEFSIMPVTITVDDDIRCHCADV